MFGKMPPNKAFERAAPKAVRPSRFTFCDENNLHRANEMIIKCPKCFYVKKENELVPDYECPACGIVYEKYSRKITEESNKKDVELEKAELKEGEGGVKIQNIIVASTAIIVTIMVLFPPFHQVTTESIFNTGYSFILSPPGYSTINSGTLFVQMFAACIIGSLLFFMLKSSKVTLFKKKRNNKIQSPKVFIVQKQAATDNTICPKCGDEINADEHECTKCISISETKNNQKKSEKSLDRKSDTVLEPQSLPINKTNAPAMKVRLPMSAYAIMIAIMILGALVRFGIRNNSVEGDSNNAFLEEIAKSINYKGPILVDSQTRLDKASVGPGPRLNLHYTLINYSSVDVNSDLIDVIKDDLRPKVVNFLCSSKEMNQLFKHGNAYTLSYFGNEGIKITSFEVNKNDCQSSHRP
jgi:hypothetical protein